MIHSVFLIRRSQCIKLKSCLGLYHIVKMHKFIFIKNLFVNCSERTMFLQELREHVVEPILKLSGLSSNISVSIHNSSWSWPNIAVYGSLLLFNIDYRLLLFNFHYWFFLYSKLMLLFINIIAKSSQNDPSDCILWPVLFYLVH